MSRKAFLNASDAPYDAPFLTSSNNIFQPVTWCCTSFCNSAPYCSWTKAHTDSMHSWHSSNTKHQGKQTYPANSNPGRSKTDDITDVFYGPLYRTVVINQAFKHISSKFWGLKTHHNTGRWPAVWSGFVYTTFKRVWAAISKTREECVTVSWGDTHALGVNQLCWD